MENSPEKDRGKKGPESGGAPARDGSRATRAAGISSDLSFDEQVQIIGQINRVVARNKIRITDDTFSFSARKRGVLIPLLINLGALAVLMTAGFFLVRYFDRQEATLVTETTRILTAEAKLIEAFKQESEARLSEKDREIDGIRERLTEIEAERRRLQLEGETLVRQREARLQAELERLLEEERSKLRQEGIADAAIQLQLEDLEARLRDENREEVEALRRQSEQNLAAKDAELAGLEEELRRREDELEARFQEETERLETERSRIDDQLAQLRESRQQEALVLEQLAAAYGRVEAEMQAGRPASASGALDSLENFLATPAFAELPAVRQRLPQDRFTIKSLRELIAARRDAAEAEKDAMEAESAGEAEVLLALIGAKVAEADLAAASGDEEGALGLYGEALAAVPDLRRSHEALLAPSAAAASAAERRLAEAQSEIRRLSAELRGARAAAAARSDLAERLASLSRRYGELSSGSVSERVSPEQVLALVETKLRIREAMTSEPMKSRYPDLYPALETYLDAYAADQRARAQDAALRDVIAVLEALGARRDSLPDLAGGYSTPRGDLFAELLNRLATLLR